MSGIKGVRYIDENGREVLTGGLKAAQTNKKKYGKGFYAKIGQIGGRNGNTGGFAANRALARAAGAKGGRISKRGSGSVVVTKLEPNKDRIIKLYNKGFSIPQISESLGVSYTTLLHWAKDNIPGYGDD